MKRKTVLITGSSKGLGRDLAIVFSKNGYNIILHGRNKKNLNKVHKEILKNNVACDIIIGDITKKKTIDKLSKIAFQRNISILINNAAIMSKDLIQNITHKEIEDVTETNFIAPIKLICEVYPLFIKKGEGMIININSIDGLETDEKRSLYSATKFALRAFMNDVRKEGKKHNIRALSVYPAGMQSDFHKRVGGHEDFSNCMKTIEVAELIFNLTKDNSVLVEEIVLNRKRRL